MKHRNVLEKTLVPTNTNRTYNSSKRTQSRAGNPSRRISIKLANLLIGLILGVILFGIIILHRRLDELEATSHAKKIAKNKGIKVDHLPIQASNNKQIISSHIRGRGVGSARGQVECDADISSLVSYWDDPLSDADRSFRSPFWEQSNEKQKKYVSFEPDMGGFNNVRMEFEIMLVFAAATGRTLIMPPDAPHYLLQRDATMKYRGLQHFFHKFDDVVDVISTEDFYNIEVLDHQNSFQPPKEEELPKLLNAISKCDIRKKSKISCEIIYEHLSEIAEFVPEWEGEQDCLIMDDKNWLKDTHGEVTDEIKRFCGTRVPAYYNSTIHNAQLIHFHTGANHKETRLLSQYYAFIHFTNPKLGNYYKRLIRNRCRYSDEIMCSSGKIIQRLMGEQNDTKNNSFSTMHIRRGDFQWKSMRISAEEWYENTKDVLHPGETVYIATDETNRTFFEPLATHYNLNFLSDYQDVVNQVDPNFIGMIDQVVCSRGRVFVGTYFSSFSAYIGRIRGYHGTSNKQMFYGQRERKYETHSWQYPHSSYSAREYPTAWNGIDGDTEPSELDFF